MISNMQIAIIAMLIISPSIFLFISYFFRLKEKEKENLIKATIYSSIIFIFLFYLKELKLINFYISMILNLSLISFVLLKYQFLNGEKKKKRDL